jgi:hypothetical protein
VGTLAPATRKSIQKKIQGKNEAEVIKAADKDPELKEFINGLNAFRVGGIVRTDKETFWVSDALREPIVKEVKKKFLSAYATSNWMVLAGAVPIWQEDGNKLRFIYDVNLTLLPNFVGNGRLIVETDAEPSARGKPDEWRIVALDLIRGGEAPTKLETDKDKL